MDVELNVGLDAELDVDLFGEWNVDWMLVCMLGVGRDVELNLGC